MWVGGAVVLPISILKIHTLTVFYDTIYYYFTKHRPQIFNASPGAHISHPNSIECCDSLFFLHFEPKEKSVRLGKLRKIDACVDIE